MTMGQLDQHLSLEGDIIGMEIRNVGLKGRLQDLHGNAGHVNETYSWQGSSSYHVTSSWQVSSLWQVKSSQVTYKSSLPPRSHSYKNQHTGVQF